MFPGETDAAVVVDESKVRFCLALIVPHNGHPGVGDLPGRPCRVSGAGVGLGVGSV